MDIENTSPSVLLFFDKERYMFNTGEGIQRFCREHKLRVSKVCVTPSRPASTFTCVSPSVLRGFKHSVSVGRSDTAGQSSHKILSCTCWELCSSVCDCRTQSAHSTHQRGYNTAVCKCTFPCSNNTPQACKLELRSEQTVHNE